MALRVGQKVKITDKPHLGVATVKFFGPTKFATGNWVGLALKTPDGKNNGVVKGVKYFECEPNHGLFVRETAVTPIRKRESLSSDSGEPQTPKTPASPVTQGKTATTSVSLASKKALSEELEEAEEEAQPAGLDVVASIQLESKVKEQESIIVELKEYVSQLAKWKSGAQESIKQLKKEVKGYQEQLSSAQEKHAEALKDLEREKSQAKEDLNKDHTKAQRQWEKEKLDLEEQIADLNESLEMVTLDKEYAEENAEALEQEAERLREQLKLYEQDKNDKESQTTEMDSVTQAKFDELRLQNDRLKEALMRLKDLSVQEKQEAQKKIKELTRQNNSIPTLEEKLIKLETDVLALQDENDDLKSALDEASGMEDTLQELVDKNLKLGDQVAELRSTVEELEELRDVSEELEENQAHLEKELRSELNRKEIQLQDLATSFRGHLKKSKEKDVTINQFRDKIKVLEQELYMKREKELEQQQAASQLENRSLELLDQNIRLKSRIVNYEALAISEQLRKLEAQQAQKQLSILKSFLPQDFFSSDQDSIQCLLLADRIVIKTKIVIKNVQQTFEIEKYLSHALASLTPEGSTPNRKGLDIIIFFWKV